MYLLCVTRGPRATRGKLGVPRERDRKEPDSKYSHWEWLHSSAFVFCTDHIYSPTLWALFAVTADNLPKGSLHSSTQVWVLLQLLPLSPPPPPRNPKNDHLRHFVIFYVQILLSVIQKYKTTYDNKLLIDQTLIRFSAAQCSWNK